jgi:MerR family transcriptional regulator, light-induced transcriptional regulator
MEREFLTSAQVASLLGVGPTSVKRWTDSGNLPCVRTPGGHRRFLRDEVERFLERGSDGWSLDWGDAHAWVDRWIHGASPFEVQSALCAERNRRGSWWKVAEALSGVIGELGQRWEGGRLSILDEHAATECLTRALARCSESISVPQGAPTCLLVSAEGEDHTLGLSLGEVVLRGAGWRARWGGRNTPLEEVVSLMRTQGVDLVAVTASIAFQDSEVLAAQARTLAAATEESGVPVVLAGGGAWPEPPSGPGGRLFRVQSFENFDQLLGKVRSEEPVARR